MGKSYRIRTTPGEDKNINVQIDQDFETLEILSLKIRQQDVYTRMCSDYGVLAGRVFANKGYGIPNAKVSIFVPVTEEDAENPVINAIYPFKNLEQTNEDGYKFNLLPYTPQYLGHTPTGTFPTRLDTLINQTVVELYDKYYKFTVTTNDSGDFLIFGVPVGDQTIVLNLDLSDMGPFSLTPQDLIRMGLATEGDFDGVNFKSSTNFNELPQILVINKTVEVVPFWGEEDTCQIGITRTDFDITGEKNIDIEPTSVFMGSLMSSNEKTAVKTYNVAKKQTGDLCKLITGPGEIIALTQTIFRDDDGLPIIERASLPNGGKLIDGSGSWMFELPMNSEYVTTNEFGEQIISDDPNVGIPTKGKFRFKIKWQQSRSLSEDYKRGYYLVPNIREKGWQAGVDPSDFRGSQVWRDFQTSYAFSLSWSSYTTGALSMLNPEIADIVDCEDTFYEFEYNKVYTVSQFIDNIKLASHREKFIGIKTIEDSTCEDVTNRYPVNDAVLHTPFTWIITNFLLVIIGILGLAIIIAYSLIAFVWFMIKIGIYIVVNALLTMLELYFIDALAAEYATVIPPGPNPGRLILLNFLVFVAVPALFVLFNYWFLTRFIKIGFQRIKLPMLVYPDCDICECQESGDVDFGGQYTGNNDDTISFSGLTQGDLDLNSGDIFSGNNQFTQNVLDTFTCQKLVDLNCYEGDGLRFRIKPNCANDKKVDNGCYVFVSTPLLGLFGPNGDIKNWAEYTLRFRFNYALCQGVFSSVFSNNWINGNLYAFPFKINTFYNRLNQVKSRQYPRSLVVLHEETNNFYYRVTPYNNGNFIGKQFSQNPSDGQNIKNIMFPTTILNMGPKNDVLKYLTLSPSYYGYNMKNINSTSYNDLSDMINFFSVLRLLDTNFLTSLLTLSPLKKMFSRPKQKVDADFAQSSAINSQLGVIPFDSDFYTTAQPNPNIIAAGTTSNNIMMGIFFQSSKDDIQSRDYISPNRIIRYNRFTRQYTYDYLPTKSQKVPMYRWRVDGGSTIFGSQTNDWDTRLQSNGGLFSERYQSLDRISSPYPRAGNILDQLSIRGYLFAAGPTPTLTSGPLQIGQIYTILVYYPGDDFIQAGAPNNNVGTIFQASGQTSSWSNGSILQADPPNLPNATPNPNPGLVGAPWYFYFGVVKGDTALNKFVTKYIGETVLNEE